MKNRLLNIIKHYGVRKQLKYFQSEIYELNEAIISYETSNYYGIENRDYEETKEHIAEEISDVMVMLKQIQYYYDIEDEKIKEIMKYKIHRQLDRINEEKQQ